MKMNGLCRRCGGPKRGRALGALASAQCGTCGDEVCEKHVKWDGDNWICTKCAKASKASPN